MSGDVRKKPRTIWRHGVLVWILLLCLLGLSLGSATTLPESWATMLVFGSASAQALLVAFLFMRLKQASILIRLAAACGVFWLAILFALTLTDTLSRISNS